MTIQVTFVADTHDELVKEMEVYLGVKADSAQEEPVRETVQQSDPLPKEEEQEEAPKPKPKKTTRKGKEIQFEDVTEAAARLVASCDGDMRRAQEIVYSEFNVRKVSKIPAADYAKAHRWMHARAQDMEDIAADKLAKADAEDNK